MVVRVVVVVFSDPRVILFLAIGVEGCRLALHFTDLNLDFLCQNASQKLLFGLWEPFFEEEMELAVVKEEVE